MNKAIVLGYSISSLPLQRAHKAATATKASNDKGGMSGEEKMRKMTWPCDKKIKTVGCVETVAKIERGKKYRDRSG